MSQPMEPIPPDPMTGLQPVEEETPAPGEIREQLLSGVEQAQAQPDLAYLVYQKLGIENPNVTTKGYQELMQNLQPGDLVGWKGGQEPDGRYIGNLAVWAGNGEIIENVFGRNRRRKLGMTENTFGIPVNLDGDAPFEGPDKGPEDMMGLT